MIIQSIVADNLAPPESVTPPVRCGKIVVVESGGLATSDFIVRAPLVSSPGFRVAAGQQIVLEANLNRPFNPDEPAFYLETVSGTLTFTVMYAQQKS